MPHAYKCLLHSRLQYSSTWIWFRCTFILMLSGLPVCPMYSSLQVGQIRQYIRSRLLQFIFLFLLSIVPFLVLCVSLSMICLHVRHPLFVHLLYVCIGLDFLVLKMRCKFLGYLLALIMRGIMDLGSFIVFMLDVWTLSIICRLPRSCLILVNLSWVLGL